MIIRSTARSMPQEPRPSDEAIQAYREAAAAEDQARRDAGADDLRNYARPATGTPERAAYTDDAPDIEGIRNLTPRERALHMREKARAFLIDGHDNDAAINGR